MLTVLPDRFVEMLVHDLRSPLNVLRLTLHVIDEVISGHDVGIPSHGSASAPPELGEDISMMRKNLDDIDRMLMVLVDFHRLGGASDGFESMPFDPSRLLRDQVDLFVEQNPGSRVALEPLGGPAEVCLEPRLAGLAVSLALSNAAIATEDRYPIRVVLRGAPDRCIVEVIVEGRPRDSVESTELTPESFQRILGSPGERRGLDLATVARISELLGGQARLDVEPGQRSSIVMDWPARLESSP